MTTPSIPGWQLLSRTSAVPDNVPVLAEVDVLVVGGGAAGVAAATVAAEAGHSTMLVERYGFCGGAAVAGMSSTICGMYLSQQNLGTPEQVVFGFTERFRSAIAERRGLTPPQIYGKTYTVTHDPLKWRETADQFLEDAGVTCLFHSAVTGVIVDGNTYTGVILESNAGSSVVLAKRIVDASGDAAVLARGGYDYWFGDDGTIQNPTMFFRLGNVDMEAFSDFWGPDTISPPKVSDLIDQANEHGFTLPRRKIWIFPSTRPGELMVNATRLTGRNGEMLNVINPSDFTEAEIGGRHQVRSYARFLAESIPGLKESFVVDTGVEAGIRQTRTIAGMTTLTNEDVVGCVKRSDSICRSPWPIELHSGDRPKLHWLLDDYYDVPYGALVPAVAEGIIIAGRSLSAQHEALASARVTAQCFEYGHAAGVAAHLSLEGDLAIRDLDVGAIQKQMLNRGSALS
ncbi:FAD-dependent oxidoreductase [Demetria terragena]|uniref:FAD-dependent oxidoreductase n=1 Tax=Demetria terragena TaxID=63959 RepID=UPI0003726DF1|nr:FAD-dependent oxidoreductase [Demetria terragena]